MSKGGCHETRTPVRSSVNEGEQVLPRALPARTPTASINRPLSTSTILPSLLVHRQLFFFSLGSGRKILGATQASSHLSGTSLAHKFVFALAGASRPESEGRRPSPCLSGEGISGQPWACGPEDGTSLTRSSWSHGVTGNGRHGHRCSWRHCGRCWQCWVRGWCT